MDRQTVVLLTTGGTVATAYDILAERSSPALGAADMRERSIVPGIEVIARDVSQVASWRLDPAAMANIAAAALEAANTEGVHGVVVAHGTSTLEYTAFLTDLLLDDETPVVFTGAMRRADDPAPDGPRNLKDAVRVAASREARGLGALVVFAGRIISAGSVWKAQRTEVDAFVDLDGDVGSVDPSAIRVHRRPERGKPLKGPLTTDVAFVKAVPGADGRMVQAAIGDSTRGLVVEGLPGAGGIPGPMQPDVLAAARLMPVVIASRAPYGRLPADPTGGTGEPLRGAHLLSAGRLTAEQAWLTLMVVLGEQALPEAARSEFARIAGHTGNDRTQGAIG